MKFELFFNTENWKHSFIFENSAVSVLDDIMCNKNLIL